MGPEEHRPSQVARDETLPKADLADVEKLHRLANEQVDLWGNPDPVAQQRYKEIEEQINAIRQKPEWGGGQDMKEMRKQLKEEGKASPPQNSYQRIRREKGG